jgi:hypothetical protein
MAGAAKQFQILIARIPEPLYFPASPKAPLPRYASDLHCTYSHVLINPFIKYGNVTIASMYKLISRLAVDHEMVYILVLIH